MVTNPSGQRLNLVLKGKLGKLYSLWNSNIWKESSPQKLKLKGVDVGTDKESNYAMMK
jgi:hypothetical protein